MSMLEKMYADFVSNVLPKVQEGMVITKDYFMDLFGRYVKYLIITDALTLVLCVVLLPVALYATYKMHKYGMSNSGRYDYSRYFDEVLPGFIVFGLVVTSFFLCIGIKISSENLVKDIYIPEVRVYEALKNFQR